MPLNRAAKAGVATADASDRAVASTIPNFHIAFILETGVKRRPKWAGRSGVAAALKGVLMIIGSSLSVGDDPDVVAVAR
jgi:hypothetical protein